MRWRGDGLRAWKQNTNGQQPKLYFLYDGDKVVCELGPTGTPIRAYGYGPNGLVQRYSSSGNTYTGYTFDPSGNLVQRHDRFVSTFPVSTVIYDGMGHLWSDTLASTGGVTPPIEPIGPQGISGIYTDEETRAGGTATGLALSASNYYDPNTGRFLAHAGDRYYNEYEAQLLPYKALSSLGKGLINGAWASAVDFVSPALDAILIFNEVDPDWYGGQWAHYQIRHPFQIGTSKVERGFAAFGEFTAMAGGAFFGATGAVRGVAGAAKAELNTVKSVGGGAGEELYHIQAGVHRSRAAHEIGDTTIPARIDGGPVVNLPIDKLRSPKTSLDDPIRWGKAHRRALNRIGQPLDPQYAIDVTRGARGGIPIKDVKIPEDPFSIFGNP